MNQFAPIVADLTATANNLKESAAQIVKTVEQFHAAQQEALKGYAPNVPTDVLSREVAGRLDYSRLASEFEPSDIAEHVDVSAVANEISVTDIANEIDLSSLASEISATDIANEFDMDDLTSHVMDALGTVDTDAIAERVASDIGAREVAEAMDMDEVATAVANNIDMDEVASAIGRSMDAEEVATVGREVAATCVRCPDTMAALVTALVQQESFVDAVAKAIADRMLGRAAKPDAFVPASEGPDGEQFDTLKS
jgi:hypothetical protein